MLLSIFYCSNALFFFKCLLLSLCFLLFAFILSISILAYIFVPIGFLLELLFFLILLAGSFLFSALVPLISTMLYLPSYLFHTRLSTAIIRLHCYSLPLSCLIFGSLALLECYGFYLSPLLCSVPPLLSLT